MMQKILLILFFSFFNIINAQNFHDTNGEIDVDNGGQLQYNLAIAIPPGIKSVAPQINLNYSSSSGNGIAGYGWHISGLPKITREGKNIEKDGIVEGVQLSKSDFFSLNGQRLILKSGEYGGNAEYKTDVFSNTKITSNNNGATFEVTLENGSTFIYSSSINPLDYLLEKTIDKNGNYITYSYKNVQSRGKKVIIIDKISWGGNEILNKPHFNEIIFNYTNRKVIESSNLKENFFFQPHILKSIIVNTNSTLFKKYEFEFETDTSTVQYEYLKKITEYNSNNEAANPVIFYYNKSQPGDEDQKIYLDNNFNDIYTSTFSSIYGDFDGNGLIDIATNKKIHFNIAKPDRTSIESIDIPKGTYTANMLSVRTLNPNNEFYSNQSIASIQTDSKTILNVYKIINNSLSLDFSKEVNFNTKNEFIDCEYSYQVKMGLEDIKKPIFLENDFDGDGVSEILMLSAPVEKFQGQHERDYDAMGTAACYFYPEEIIEPSKARILRVLPNADITLGSKDYIEISNSNIPILNEYEGKYNFFDFDGDGIKDLIVTGKKDNNSAFYKIYSIKLKKTAPYYEFKEIINGFLTGNYNSITIGDYNGDGKMDIFIAQKEDSPIWRLYQSTGDRFIEHLYSDFTVYKPSHTGAPRKRRETLKTYYAFDTNNDGKSEFIIFESQKWFRDGVTDWNDPDASFGITRFVYNGIDDVTGTPIFKPYFDYKPVELNSDIETLNYSMYGEHYSLLFKGILDNSLLISHKTKLISLNFEDYSTKSRIQSIYQGKVLTEVIYDNLYGYFSNSTISGNSSQNTTYYVTDKPVTYPYDKIRVNRNFYIVSELKQDARKQHYKYQDLIAHYHGKGTIGFKRNSRTSWFTDDLIKTKVWSGSEIDYTNSLPTYEWSIKNQFLYFPIDFSFTDNNLLSLSLTEYKKDNFNGQKIILPIKKIIKDFLKDITVTNNTEYDPTYFIPIKESKNIAEKGIYTSLKKYQHNPLGVGKNYYIGRLEYDYGVTKAYNDSKQSLSKFSYDANNNLSKFETFDPSSFTETNYNGNVLKREEYLYDNFGNQTSKTEIYVNENISLNESFVYEEKGRFVKEKINYFGKSTQISYNDWGLILTEKDPFENTLINTYDGWGKLVQNESSLFGVTKYEYGTGESSSIYIGNYTFTKTIAQNGSISIDYKNKYGLDYARIERSSNNNNYILLTKSYDDIGRLRFEYSPQEISSIPTNIYFPHVSLADMYMTYNDDYYPAKVTTTNLDKVSESRIDGRKTIIEEKNGYLRTYTKTTDELGNIISSTDKGGTILYEFNALNQQIKATYGNNIVTTKYDDLGRKIEFHDPSNGIYKYEYSPAGSLLKEISPKGYKKFEYNNLNQLNRIIEKSNDSTTDKNFTLTYDSFGRKTDSQGISNGKPYSLSVVYDSKGRVNLEKEIANNNTFYVKNDTYDAIGRLINFEKGIIRNGTTHKISIRNEYNTWSGSVKKIVDNTNNIVLFEEKDFNNRGLSTSQIIGKTNITTTYNNKGILQKILHKNDVSDIINIDYEIDHIKNELTKRSNNRFNIIEKFIYDDNNRLIQWTNPKDWSIGKNTYDEKGRIIEHNALGKINFASNDKIYQPLNINLTGSAVAHHSIINPSQEIVYNENNDPVSIKTDYAHLQFDYGISENRQYFFYKDLNSSKSFEKFYSISNDFEIIKDLETNKEKFIIYLEGSPYESSIVAIKDYNSNALVYHFLHKDYLDNILAITDINGNLIEERHFDAWGNLTHGKIDFIDRGYTSHEHLTSAHLIHMNGRLYDPSLRRFLNADENIQDPYNTQNYNKYSYVFNNPLMYNDPDGEFVWWVPLAIAFVSQTSQAYYNNSPMNAGSFIKAVALSYASAAASYGIGEIFSAGEVTSALGKFSEIARHVSHGISGGLMSSIQGDNFNSGFMSGVFGSVGGSISQFLVGNSFSGNLISGAILGGSSSQLFGGNFWIGAFNGISSSVFNHFEHAPDNGYEPDGKGGWKKINDLGGDLVDVAYDSDGNILGWKFVQKERATNELDRPVRTYSYKKTSGGAVIDPTGEIVYMYIGVGLATEYVIGKVVAHIIQKYPALSMTFSSTKFALSTALQSASSRGYTEVGYQLSKHAGRLNTGNSQAWKSFLTEGAINPQNWNQAGLKMLKEIWRAPGSFKRVNGFLEKRLPNGMGVRFQENWKFKGFID
jgi:RHS repeat-associated protein